MSLSHARAIAALTAAALLAAACTDTGSDKQPGLEWKPLATAKPGEVTSIIGDGSPMEADSSLPAARSSVSGPVALAEGDDGELLVMQREALGRTVAVSADGHIRIVAPLNRRIMDNAWSMVRLPDGDLAALELGNTDGSSSEMFLSRIDRAGTLSGWMRLKAPVGLPGVPGLVVSPSGGLLVVWAGHVWMEEKGKLIPHSLAVPGAVRAVADGQDLLVATQESVHRVRGGKVVNSHRIRPSGERWGKGGYVTAIASDGKGGTYVAIGPEGPAADPYPPGPSVVFHVPVAGAPTPVAFGQAPADCDGAISGSAQGSTPLKDPRALLIRNDQLFIADTECNRVFAVGLSGSSGT